MLNANSATAAKRVPNPRSSRTGRPSSALVPSTAATAGGSTRHVVFVAEQRQRDVPVVQLGKPGQEEHARDVDAKREREERLQPVDERASSAYTRAARCGQGHCGGRHGCCSWRLGTRQLVARRANAFTRRAIASACRWRCTCAAPFPGRTSARPRTRRPVPPRGRRRRQARAASAKITGANAFDDHAHRLRAARADSRRRASNATATSPVEARLMHLPDAQHRDTPSAANRQDGSSANRCAVTSLGRDRGRAPRAVRSGVPSASAARSASSIAHSSRATSGRYGRSRGVRIRREKIAEALAVDIEIAARRRDGARRRRRRRR